MKRGLLKSVGRSDDAGSKPDGGESDRLGAVASARKPNEVDCYVGNRLRLLRRMRDVSQEQLARQVGIAPQQIQKYEKGETRISASRLYDFATLFEVPIVYFFDGLEGSAGPEDVIGGRRDVPSPLPIEAPGQEAVARLLANYDVLSPRLQLKLVEIARVMAEIEAGPDD